MAVPSHISLVILGSLHFDQFVIGGVIGGLMGALLACATGITIAGGVLVGSPHPQIVSRKIKSNRIRFIRFLGSIKQRVRRAHLTAGRFGNQFLGSQPLEIRIPRTALVIRLLA